MSFLMQYPCQIEVAYIKIESLGDKEGYFGSYYSYN